MAIGAIISIGSLALSAYQSYVGAKAAQEAEEERIRLEKEAAEAPGFEVTPEMRLDYQRKLAASQYGFSPEEWADFRRRSAGYSAGVERQTAELAGGQLAPAVAMAQKGKQIEAASQFAATGARFKQQKLGEVGRAAVPFQTAADKEVQRKLDWQGYLLDYNLMQQQAAGLTMQTGIKGALNVGWNQAVLEAYKTGQIPTDTGVAGAGTPSADYNVGNIYDIYNPNIQGYNNYSYQRPPTLRT